MKFTLPLESRKLSSLLEKAVSREAKLWKVYVPKKPTNQDTDISPEKRDEAVRWLRDVHSQLKLYPETLCLAIGILDRFLSAIKARPKYLRCIAISCFFLAVKTSEEDEVNAVLIYIIIIFFPLFQIDSSQLIGCRELVARCLSTYTASLPPNTVYICHPLPAWHISPALTAPSDPNTTHTRSCKSSAKRKVEHMEVDEYFDGIKRLYSEESPQEGAPTCTAETVGGGQGLLVIQQNAGFSPCPPLQPVRET
ncbi:cyclin-I-like [Sinocyclocheilus anshuiensis]|uniref:cyclin-I-like n=1 Tax=Sinocyclocheilus anshuiensis TaxID=1608454 RepID=UPI0007B98B93|nr:PREDICTED: cyclin-I-like [Sinocyclocheilus anshuiensis]